MAVLIWVPLAFVLTGCQLGYILNSGWQQAKLYNKRQPIAKILAAPETSPEIKRKLELVLAASAFAEHTLGLKHSNNYKKFVQLDRPHVSYIVHAAPAFKLESYQWWFPITGHVPYKGYFNRADAEEEAKEFDPQKFDTYVRGVTAYSTLGWFDDPVFSSMLNYSDHDLVNVIIHETVHVTLFIKSNAEFNERLATFLGDWGTHLFYEEKEGKDSPTLKLIAKEAADQKIFSQFLSQEMSGLRVWYASLGERTPVDEKKNHLAEILTRFSAQIKPQLKTDMYQNFPTQPLNNARLLAMGTYYQDLVEFEKLGRKLHHKFTDVLAYCKTLEKDPAPLSTLQKFVSDVN